MFLFTYWTEKGKQDWTDLPECNTPDDAVLYLLKLWHEEPARIGEGLILFYVPDGSERRSLLATLTTRTVVDGEPDATVEVYRFDEARTDTFRVWYDYGPQGYIGSNVRPVAA
jgi:hypothetical protein